MTDTSVGTSVLDDARRLMGTFPPVRTEAPMPGYSYIRCEACPRTLDSHAPRCPSVVLPRIVAALEVAEAMRAGLTRIERRLDAVLERTA